MLISKTTTIKWVSSNKDRYIKLGYKFTKMKDTFEVKVEDLSDYSRAEVEVKCDYCGKIIKKKWINYISEHKKNNIHKDACNDCKYLKNNDAMMEKYGVSNVMKIPNVQEKFKASNLEKYGFENASSHPSVRKKVAETNIKRYGGIAPTCSSEVMAKQQNTFMEKYGVKSALCMWDRSGENNPNWKGGVSYNPDDERLSMDCYRWKRAVYKKDDYTCQCCGNRNGVGIKVKLNAHHIFNWNDYEELRYDLDNGITLCEKCHIEFHRIYGKKNNTQSQLDEFLNNYGQKIC